MAVPEPTVIGQRRRAIAAVATALAAVALAATVAGRGCRDGDDQPEGAVRALVAAARAGDRAALFELLGPATRARLEAAATRTTELVGGTRRFAARDMIELVPARPASVVVRERTPDRAVVELTDDAGAHARLAVVRVDGRWRVELPAGSP